MKKLLPLQKVFLAYPAPKGLAGIIPSTLISDKDPREIQIMFAESPFDSTLNSIP